MAGFSDSNATYGADTEAVSDILNTGTALEAALVVGTTAGEIKVGSNRLLARKCITLHNNSSVTIYWGYTSGVTTSTGTPIYANQFYSWDVGDLQPVYVIAATTGNNTRITEG